MAVGGKERIPIPYDKRLVELFAADDNPEARAEDYLALAVDLGTPRTIDFVIEQTLSKNERIATAAREAVERFPRDKILLPLARAVFPEATADIPSTTHLLSEIEEPQRAELLKTAILSGIEIKEKPVRARSAREVTAFPLVEILIKRSLQAAQDLKDHQETVYPAASEAFKSIYYQSLAGKIFVAGGNKAIPTVVGLLDAKDTYVQKQATRVLVEINTDEAWEKLLENQVKIRQLDEATMEKVVERGDPKFRPLVLRFISQEGKYSFDTLKGSPEAIDFLISTTEEENREELIPVLAWHTKSQDIAVARCAVEELIRIGSDQAIGIVLETLERSSIAIEPLTRFIASGDGQIVEKLLAATTLDSGRRVKAILETADSSVISAAINKALRQEIGEKEEISYQIAYLAPELGLSECIPVLKEVMAKEKRGNTAGHAIAKFGTLEALKLLVETLKNDPEPTIRMRAVNAFQSFSFEEPDQVISEEEAKLLEKLTLGELITPKQEVTAALLASARKDPDPEVRRSAVFSLGEVGNMEVARVLFIMLNDKDKSVGLAALSTINKIFKRETRPL